MRDFFSGRGRGADLLDRFSEHTPRAMRVRHGDPHPSPFGHEVAAEAIYDWIAGELPLAEASR